MPAGHSMHSRDVSAAPHSNTCACHLTYVGIHMGSR
jgi:hypothetical protein